ncbi:MAG: hypothetical protein CL579_12595 [Alteromonadaceae bacterium]|nr:hypothetical protein [Alteromonadaceae bacterium]MBB20857.1 hypothetical protein [Rickettsiales bacterium]
MSGYYASKTELKAKMLFFAWLGQSLAKAVCSSCGFGFRNCLLNLIGNKADNTRPFSARRKRNVILITDILEWLFSRV